MNGRTRTRIEQAIAFGRSLDWILEHLDVTPQDVDEALQWLDECNAEPDEPPYVPPTYGRALERERGVVAGNATAARARQSLLAQIVDTPRGDKCGTYAAYCRHQRRWEPVDPLCRLAARDYARATRRRQRAERKAA